MAGPFEFPEHPLSRKEDPFVDAAGNNPFADPEMSDQIDSNPYGTGAAEFRPYQPRDHVMSMRSRGPTIFLLGACGALGAIGIVICTLFSRADWGVLLGVFSVIVSFVFGPAAWILGTHDLRAITAGAMDSHGRLLTALGRMFGVSTTLGAVFYLLYVAVRMVESWSS
ncbi:MAG: hypothetical protein VX346_01350 [Planctomycetota bacterium]|nr:hypothetical protein [Planctomycetota bacterium]